MEVLALLAFGGFILWMISRSAGNRRLAAEQERRRDLAVFRWDRGDDTFTDFSVFNFAAMQCQHTTGIDDVGIHKRHTRTFLLRRRDGHWETQLTSEEWRKESTRLNEAREECRRNIDAGKAPELNRGTLEEVEAQLAHLANGPVWDPIADEIAGPLETAYQRYVRQG